MSVFADRSPEKRSLCALLNDLERQGWKFLQAVYTNEQETAYLFHKDGVAPAPEVV